MDTLGKTLAPQTATSKPYKISNSHMKNKWFYPKKYYEHVEEGYASYYGGRDIFHGRKTATGDIFDKNKIMGAHREVPIPCVLRVTNIDSKSEGYGRSIKIPVLDRGPFAHIDKRIIDVSEKSAKLLGFYNSGTAKVRIETLIPESIQLAQAKRLPVQNNNIMLAQGNERDRKTPYPMVLASRKQKQVVSLSKEKLNALIKRGTSGTLPSLPHSKSLRKQVSPPARILVAQAEKIPAHLKTKLPSKPQTINDLFGRS